MGLIKVTAVLFYSILLCSCNSFMHGYTFDKSVNSYSLVTNDKKNFGNKRIKYNKGFHNKSALQYFLTNRDLPDFIYEYKTQAKCEGIKLFYAAVDSVYAFEEPKKNNLRSILKEARRMDEYERLTYKRLQEK